MKAKDLRFDDISVGDEASFDRMIVKRDVEDFARLSGDMNPIHFDDSYAQATQFGHPIVHGMLVGSLCSALVGMHLPGKRCLYLSQTLIFKNPVFIGDTVTVRGKIKTKSPSTRLIEIEISVTRGGTEVMEGTAMVKVL